MLKKLSTFIYPSSLILNNITLGILANSLAMCVYGALKKGPLMTLIFQTFFSIHT